MSSKLHSLSGTNTVRGIFENVHRPYYKLIPTTSTFSKCPNFVASRKIQNTTMHCHYFVDVINIFPQSPNFSKNLFPMICVEILLNSPLGFIACRIVQYPTHLLSLLEFSVISLLTSKGQRKKSASRYNIITSVISSFIIFTIFYYVVITIVSINDHN